MLICICVVALICVPLLPLFPRTKTSSNWPHPYLRLCCGAGCHGHHGQVPAGEYLVATAAHEQHDGMGAPRFLPWRAFLALCLELQLPLNDTWLLAGTACAAAGRALLDATALSGGTTASVMTGLHDLVVPLAAGGGGECGRGLHLAGTYPHEQWQGSRLEGFVVSQGQHIAGACDLGWLQCPHCLLPPSWLH